MIKGSLRRDPLNKCWVVFAPEKVNTIIKQSSEKDSEFDLNPYAPGYEFATGKDILRKVNPAYAHQEWSVRVFPAKKPVLLIESEVNFRGQGLYDRMERLGAHEVVVETPRQNIHFDQLSIEEITDVLSVIRERVGDLRKDTRFRYISVCKNKGLSAGGTINHNYSEIKAYPFVPPMIQCKIDNAVAYYNLKERCVLCDIVDQELTDKVRIVAENDYFLAFCPYASRFPFEIMISPKKHSSIFNTQNYDAVKELSKILRLVLLKTRKALKAPAYNCVFHQPPVNSGEMEVIESKAYHWHISVIPRMTNIQPDTLEYGVYTNPTLPEEAAQFLKNISE
jgi:UDPglucose--hexose-1-phosphate uridylyltransferase